MEARQLELEENAAVRSSPSGDSFATEEQHNCLEKHFTDESRLELVGIRPRLSLASNNIQQVRQFNVCSTFGSVCQVCQVALRM